MKKQIVAFRGINYSDQTQDGELRDALNVSARRLPYLATRKGREKLEEYAGATAMAARGVLAVVQGTQLLYDGEVVGQVIQGEKQFAVVGNKLVIWPDKTYLDLETKTIQALAASVTGTGASFKADDGVLTSGSGWMDLTTLFKAGDGVSISGCKEAGNNQDLVIKSVTKSTLTFGANVLKDATETGSITIERKIPDLDYICASENRLWGCSNQTQTIYGSALGDPTNFFVYEGVSTDSYAASVGSEGEFTGCCKHASSVLFWKQTKLHKLLGSYPAEYVLYDYSIEGLQAGCHKSLQVINEVLYYLGTHGVYAYSGGMPTLISACFGERSFTKGVAGTDGEAYYLSAWERGRCQLMVYETKSGLWMKEDEVDAVDFARMGKDLYLLSRDGGIYKMDSGLDDKNLKWMAQFTPFYETLEGRKRFSKLLLRLELPKGTWMKAEMRCDGGRWREAGTVVGGEKATAKGRGGPAGGPDGVQLRLPISRCDQFELRLSGCGPCTLQAMMLEYRVGSDV